LLFFLFQFFLYWFYFSISFLKHLVSFNLYIKFGPHCFDFYLFFYPYLNWILFSILSINIWFRFIFMWDLVLILLTFICVILDHFFTVFSISSPNIWLIEDFVSWFFKACLL
jgi:hypothetical protein